MAAEGDGAGRRWAVGLETGVTVEESGPDRCHPPVMVLAGAHCVVTLGPPADMRMWSDYAEFLRRLRDGSDDLATLLETRAERRDVAER